MTTIYFISYITRVIKSRTLQRPGRLVRIEEMEYVQNCSWNAQGKGSLRKTRSKQEDNIKGVLEK
jgi:hypothetical protein